MVDGVFLHFLQKEMAHLLVGAKVTKIIQPIKEELILILKQDQCEYKLLINVSSACPSMYISAEYEWNTAIPNMFCMLLRKHILGGRITGITQQGLDRIIYIKFLAQNQIGENRRFCLVVELMGRYSNLVLLDENEVILGAVKFLKEGQRQILPNCKYPKQEQNKKINLLEFEPQNITEEAELETLLQGVSKKTRMQLRKVARTNEEAINILTKLLNSTELPKPTVIKEENGSEFPFFEFSGVRDIKRQFSSYSELLEHFLAKQAKDNLIKQRTKDLNIIINTHKARVQNRLSVQRAELEKCAEKDYKKQCADLLGANLHLVKKGDKALTVTNFFEEGQPQFKISLDENLTGAQNMEKYYKEYRKLKTAEAKLKELIELGEKELEYFNNLSFNIEQVSSNDDIEGIKQELVEQKYIKAGKRKAQTTQAKVHAAEFGAGFKVFVGHNNLQNEFLTLKFAKKNDLWFHAQKVPGSHVILKSEPGYEPDNKIIEQAAKIAAQNSKAKGSLTVAVDYTKISNVKKMPGGKPGMVNYVNFKTIFVRPN